MYSQSKIIPTQTNQSSDKLLSLIELLSEQSEPIRLQDISRLSNMNASTALRFLSALSRRGYVAQEESTGRYYLTLKLCNLTQNISSQFDLRTIALPFLRSIADEFNESCHLAVESTLSVLYIETVSSSSRTLSSPQRVGKLAPLYCTGVGKLFLTEYSSDELERLISVMQFEKFTQSTITTVPALLAELESVKKLGYAYDNEECEEGLRCIAAPVRDYTGKIVAAISVSGPTTRMTDDYILEHLPFLINATKKLSTQIGWSKIS